MEGPNKPDLDVVLIGSALFELTPQCPGQSLAHAERLVPLPAGSAANLAVYLATAGLAVGFISRVGADELGAWLLSRLGECGIDTSLLRPVPDQLTPVSFCWADQSGEKVFYFYRFAGFSDPMATFTTEQVESAEILRGKLFDFTEATVRAEPLRSAALHAATIARQAGRTVCYAVNYRPDSWAEPLEAIRRVQKQAIAAADLVVMNEDEASLIFETQNTSVALAEAMSLGPSVVAVTSGARGGLLGHDGGPTEIASYSVPVQYDVGAGDAFHAGFVAGYLRGMSAPQSAQLGAAMAALNISRPASAPPPTWSDLQAFMRRA